MESATDDGTLSSHLDNPEWQQGIFKHWSMALILGLPVLLALLSFAVALWLRYVTKKQSKGIANDGEESNNERKATFCQSIRRGLRAETSPLRVKAILQQKLTAFQRPVGDESEADAQDVLIADRSTPTYKIHPQSNITEEDIRIVYKDYLEDIPGLDGVEDAGNKLVLFYRLASIFVSAGMSTIENEEYLYHCQKALGLPPLSLLTLGLSEITAQFKIGPVVNISCSTLDFYQLSLLSRTQQLAQLIIDGEGASQYDKLCEDEASETERAIPARVYLEVLDELEKVDVATPYGWLAQAVGVYCVCVFAPLCVYGGGYSNLAVAAIISVPITAEVVVCKRYFPKSFGTWEVPIVSFTTGLLSPILWQAMAARTDVDQCSANATIGVLLIWFPGSTLVYGAHEVFLGSYINGSARLIKGIISALVICIFYTIGWQYWGQDWWISWFDLAYVEDLGLMVDPSQGDEFLRTGPVASLPPSRDCPDGSTLPWYMGSVVFAIPFNLATLVLFNVRARDVIGAFLVSQATFAVQGALGQCREDTCALPKYVQVMVVAFAGGIFAEINQALTRFSKYGSMLAIIFVLAPGAGAVRAALGAYRRAEGDFQGNEDTLWESVVFEGVTYASGFFLAFSLLQPFHSLRKPC
ncbi:hypothetical protein ACHAXT_010996 [Thalassiosira profunda]